MLRFRLFWCALAFLLTLTASITFTQQACRVDDKTLIAAPKDAGEWLMTGRDYAETRYSPLTQINASNISRLGLAWYYDTQSEPGAVEAAPTLYNGTLYVTVTWSVVIAVDARSGEEKWRWDPEIGHKNFPPGANGNPDSSKPRIGPSLCCGPVNRGVAIYDGKVYVGLLDGRLVALDADTGKLAWQVQTTNPNADYSITGAPRIVKGKVIIGNGGAEFVVRGYVTAYDAETGKQVWRFYTVPGDPSKPENEAMRMAAKTWTGKDWWKWGGGGAPWQALSYDPKLDLLYIGTGNGGPYPIYWRSPGLGNNDNLFICSIVAVRADTGKYVWHFQETPGDEWDYDAVQDMILTDLKIDGQSRKVLLQASKNGFFYVIDRKTGQFISAMPIARVNWASGVDPKTGRPIFNPAALYGNDKTPDAAGSWVSPSGGGVHNWHGMSFNPNTGLAYIPGSTSVEWFAVDKDFKYEIGVFDWGQYRNPPVYGVRARTQPGPQRPDTQGPTGGEAGADAAPPPVNGSFLVAWNPITQKERWRIPAMNGGGTVTTGSNLVFAASSDGEFVALTADTGEKLWESKLVPGFSNPSVYMLDGKEYVAVMAGAAGHAKLYAFVLDGKAEMPVMAAPAPGRRTTRSGVFTSVQAERGKALYQRRCAVCHSDDLTGGGANPPLAGSIFAQTWEGHPVGDLFQITQTTMPKDNPGSLKPDDYADVLAFIFKRNSMTPGTEELKSTPQTLNSITITAGRSATPAAPSR